MKKRAELGFLTAILAAGAMGVTGATYAGTKFFIAHYEGNGTYEDICVSESAWYSSHQYHSGDYIITTC